MIIGGVQKLSLIDYPGKISAAIFTVGCNFRCGYCHNPELVLPEQYVKPIPADEVIDFLKTRVGKLQGVAISGGEPTVQPDLVDFISQIKELGFAIKLDSNGSHPEVLNELFQKKLIDFIAMDIKGPLDMYQTIAAMPIDIEAIKKSIHLIKKAEIGYEFRTTVVKSQLSFDDIDRIGKMVKGAERFALQRFRPGITLSPRFHQEVTYSDAEFLQMKKIMEKYVRECVIH